MGEGGVVVWRGLKGGEGERDGEKYVRRSRTPYRERMDRMPCSENRIMRIPSRAGRRNPSCLPFGGDYT